MKIKGIHHMAVAVDDIEKYSHLFESLFGLKSGPVETNPSNKVTLAFIDAGNSRLELLKPLDANSSIAKFIAKRGPGIHHFCLTVDDIHAAIDELKSKDVRMVDETPRQGAGVSLIAFIHPESTGGILIELKQETKGQ
jgi:methylmalonyl-CoA/ethylmalonyl-CoA epimerase